MLATHVNPRETFVVAKSFTSINDGISVEVHVLSFLNAKEHHNHDYIQLDVVIRTIKFNFMIGNCSYGSSKCSNDCDS